MSGRCAPFVIVAAIVVVGSAGRTAGAAEPDACTLLTTAEVSGALGVNSLPGKRTFGGSPKACLWSDDAGGSVNNRRVTLTITSSTMAFQMMKSSPRIKTEPVSGIGDEAFYELPGPHEAPILQVRKGSEVFTLRVLNGLKLTPFTVEDVKAKEASLAKAAAARF